MRGTATGRFSKPIKGELYMAKTDTAAVEMYKQKAGPASITVVEVKELAGTISYALHVSEKTEFF